MCDVIVCALKCCCASTIGCGVGIYWLCSPRFRKELREKLAEKYEEEEKERKELNERLSRIKMQLDEFAAELDASPK